MIASTQQPAATSAYERLKGIKVTRAYDGQPVELTSLWRPDLFGFGGEKAVAALELDREGTTAAWRPRRGYAAPCS